MMATRRFAFPFVKNKMLPICKSVCVKMSVLVFKVTCRSLYGGLYLDRTTRSFVQNMNLTRGAWLSYLQTQH